MSAPIIIIFGLSGVGKTTICERYVQRHPQYMHLSASQMLQEATGRMGDELRKSSAEEIQQRQRLLADVLAAKRLQQGYRPLLIDAHSVIDNDDTLVAVPSSAIAAMKPTALIFYEADPVHLLERRASDNRRRPVRTVEELTQQQKTAKAVAKRFSRELKVPFYSGNFPNIDDLSDVIKKIDFPNSRA